MKCIDPKMKKRVALYQYGMLPEAQKPEVEAHLLECESCFNKVYQTEPVLRMLDEQPELFLETLKPKPALFARQFRRIKDNLNRVYGWLDTFFASLLSIWQIPLARVLVPVAVTAILALFILYPGAGEFNDLAILEKYPYQSYKLKGMETLSPEQQLFQEGMDLYQQNKFEPAIEKLVRFINFEPENAFGHFYLGISLLLTDKTDAAIDQLQLASQFSAAIGNSGLLASCHWYLGNAYLKHDDAENASREFNQVLQLSGEWAGPAEKQLARINELSKKRIQK